MDAAVERAITESFLYDSETGVVRWASYGVRRRPSGQAGYVRKDGYIDLHLTVGGKNKRFKAHNVAWFLHYGSWPTRVLDHINRLKSDNRISNLRDVGAKTNSENIPLRRPASGGFVGTVQLKDGRYKSLISSDGKEFYLGVFATPQEAHAAYLGAKRILHKGFVPAA